MSRARRRRKVAPKAQGQAQNQAQGQAQRGAVAGGSAAADAPSADAARLLDWAGLMRAGIGGPGLLPRDFWALTPFELRVLLGLEATAAPLTRARLEDLTARFPDRVKGDRDV